MTRRQRIFWDCSYLAGHPDVQTGIQRVVRELGGAIQKRLIADAAGTEFIPCVVDGHGHVFPLEHIPLPGDAPIEKFATLASPAPGDIFVVADSNWHNQVLKRFAPYWRGGVITGVVQYDLIPFTHPETADDILVRRFHDWMIETAGFADFFASVSRSTEKELTESLARLAPWRPIREADLFHFGLAPSNAGLKRERAHGVNAFARFIAVGTIEPRKRYDLILDAFESLWRERSQAQLVLVGKPGWKTKELQERIRSLEEAGAPISWLQDVDDEELFALYSSCTALLAPSDAEGYGLPVVEAMEAGMPVVCSDIPVFREITGGNALFFRAGSADSLRELLDGVLAGRSRLVPIPADFRLQTWDDSAGRFLEGMTRCANPKTETRLFYDRRVGALMAEVDAFHRAVPATRQSDSPPPGWLGRYYERAAGNKALGFPVRLVNALLRSSQTRHKLYQTSAMLDELRLQLDSVERTLTRVEERTQFIEGYLHASAMTMQDGSTASSGRPADEVVPRAEGESPAAPGTPGSDDQ